jgi:hypothetical protein
VIRLATAADLPAIIDGAMRCYAADAISAPRRDLVAVIARDVLRRSLALVAIEVSTNVEMKILGSVGLERRTWEHSGEDYLADRWLCGERAFLELLSGARAVAARSKLPLILGISTQARLPAKLRLYRMAGGEAVGALIRF